MDNETEAVEFLERLDLDVDDLESKTTFANALDRIFQKDRIAFATRKQIDALFPIAEEKFLNFPRANIRRIEFTLYGKPQTRFIIPDHRGLFNFKSALRFFRGLRV